MWKWHGRARLGLLGKLGARGGKADSEVTHLMRAAVAAARDIVGDGDGDGCYALDPGHQKDAPMILPGREGRFMASLEAQAQGWGMGSRFGDAYR